MLRILLLFATAALIKLGCQKIKAQFCLFLVVFSSLNNSDNVAAQKKKNYQKVYLWYFVVLSLENRIKNITMFLPCVTLSIIK